MNVNNNNNNNNNNSNGNSYKNNNKMRAKWNVRASDYAQNTFNPIREIIENMRMEPNPDKQMIALSIGDPTIFGNLRPHPSVLRAMCEVITNGEHNGYAPSTGLLAAREAVAAYVAHQGQVTANDVILCSGCSCALDLCIMALADRDQNILIPRPGFSIYRTLAEGLGIAVRSYELMPEQNWEVNLKQLESLIDDATAAIVVTNPSNPCGSVFTKQHLQKIVDLAEKYFVPIIADEIYEHFVFPGTEYHSVSSLSKTVPVLSCGGLTKRFLVPGWRQGWIVIHDRANHFREIRKGLTRLSARILGSNTLVQGALPSILHNTPADYYLTLTDTLFKHARLAFEILTNIVGLQPIMPCGAMYMMIGIDIDSFPDYRNDLDFVESLVKEQSVFCLPGQCFDYPNFFRIVLTVPDEMLRVACARIAEFCAKHYRVDNCVIGTELFEALQVV